MLVAAPSSEQVCGSCAEVIGVGHLAYWLPFRGFRCTDCGPWPEAGTLQADADHSEHRRRALELAARIARAPGYRPMRIVRARNLRVGDVAQHPDTHQLGQVAELHGYPDHVDVVLVDRCVWHLAPAVTLEVRHRTVELES